MADQQRQHDVQGDVRHEDQAREGPRDVAHTSEVKSGEPTRQGAGVTPADTQPASPGTVPPRRRSRSEAQR